MIRIGNFILLIAALVGLIFPSSGRILAAEGGNTPQILCLPGIYPSDPGDCRPLGPSTYLTQMASKGITFPLSPLLAAPPDPALVNVDVRYAMVNNYSAPVYGSLEQAIAHDRKSAASMINADFAYISYRDEAVVGGKRFYMIDTNQWMTAADVSRIGVLPRFQGLVFSQTPNIQFGWIYNGPYETKRTPGDQGQDFTGHVLQPYEVVQVYAVEQVKGDNWFLVGPDEWVPHRVLARVIPDLTPPPGVTADRWISVNLEEQTLAVYEKGRMVFATLIASGAEPFWTRPGTFQIREKLDLSPMSGGFDSNAAGGYYLEDVPWAMYFDGARALHGAYWRSKLGFAQSHGCVNLSIGDAHWLFDWANVGDFVYVWDPSGLTPTDPNLYSSGGY